MKIDSSRLPLPMSLALALGLGWCAAVTAQAGGITPIHKIPSPGGQYLGPPDIVPPNLPPFDPNNPATCPPTTQAPCNPGLLPTNQCGTACPSLHFTEHPGTQCIHCQGDPDGSNGPCYSANGWDLTFGAARAFCHAPDPGCLDANQNLTVCINQASSCEVHLFESSWINHDLWTNRPVCAPVAAQACLDGNPLFSHPHAFDGEHEGAGFCGSHTVCLTFNKTCFCNAVLNWETLLNQLPGGAGAYDSQALFHVGFTTCQTCECPQPPPP